MNNVKKRLPVLPFLIIVICGGFLISWLIHRPDAGFFAIGSTGGKEHSTAVNTEGIDSVDIDWISGKVDIRTTDKKEITITEYSRKNLDAKDMFHAEVRSGVLKIDWRKSLVKNFFGINWLKKNLVVELPKELAENLEVFECSSVSGGIDARGLGSGKMDFNSTSGGIDIDGINTEKLDITTVSGHIKISDTVTEKIGFFTTSGGVGMEDIEAEDIDFTTVSGSINIDGSISGKIDGSTTSASVNIDTEVCPERVDLGTVSGHMRLAIPEERGFTAKFSAVSGSFSSDFATTSSKSGDNRTEVYLDGASSFDFSSVSGAAELLKRGK